MADAATKQRDAIPAHGGLRADLALAAYRTRLLAEQVDDPARDDLIEKWGQLLDRMDDAAPIEADSILAAYRSEIESRLTAAR